ncbi:hypothetical protein Q1695_004495 [Nippostrongylus brasiliensis]|nr:hypothetical protein Q1695_004495 [Nippostrongylus brasiliensis]
MTSFFKKLGRNRSKSPQKQMPSYPTRYVYGTPMQDEFYPHGQPRPGHNYEMNDYTQYPPVCFLPLPPSPLNQRRNESRLSMHHSNQSNVALAPSSLPSLRPTGCTGVDRAASLVPQSLISLLFLTCGCISR